VVEVHIPPLKVKKKNVGMVPGETHGEVKPLDAVRRIFLLEAPAT